MADIRLQHNIGDLLYTIKMNDSNVPEIINPQITFSDSPAPLCVEAVRISKEGVCYETNDGMYLTEDRIKNDLWFWSEKDAQDWLDKNYDPAVYDLKPGDLVITTPLMGNQDTFEVAGLRFGGAWGIIEGQDDWARAHSYTELFDRLKEPFYILRSKDGAFDRMMIGRGTEEDPYRIDYYTTNRHNPIQFPVRVAEVIRNDPSISDSL